MSESNAEKEKRERLERAKALLLAKQGQKQQHNLPQNPNLQAHPAGTNLDGETPKLDVNLKNYSSGQHKYEPTNAIDTKINLTTVPGVENSTSSTTTAFQSLSSSSSIVDMHRNGAETTKEPKCTSFNGTISNTNLSKTKISFSLNKNKSKNSQLNFGTASINVATSAIENVIKNNIEPNAVNSNDLFATDDKFSFELLSNVPPPSLQPFFNSPDENNSVLPQEEQKIGDISSSDDDDENNSSRFQTQQLSSQQTGSDFFSLAQLHSNSLLSSAASKKEALNLLSDHAHANYLPFERKLYQPVQEITHMRDHEVQAIRAANGNIKVRGRNCPKPISSFVQAGLDVGTLALLVKKRGFEVPFPIQMQAIPALLSGFDVIGIAQTGSGKTLAYLIPMLKCVGLHLKTYPMKHGDGPIGLVMLPTRELALQVTAEATKLCKAMFVGGFGLEMKVAAVVGGISISENLREFKRGSPIICATPGRLIDVLTTNNGRAVSLRRVIYLVLDEADRMFDMGFGSQVDAISEAIRPDRQVALFSATFPPHIEGLARRILGPKPLEITVGERGSSSEQIRHILELHDDNKSKMMALLKLLGEWSVHGKILIFVAQQKMADVLFAELVTYGYFALVLHAGLDQIDRQSAIEDFKNGISNILISTSVAARGLDVPNIVLVVNMDVPDHVEDYVHRVGRTGRGNNIGAACTFILTSQGDIAEELVRVVRAAGQTPNPVVVEFAENHRRTSNLTEGKRKRTGCGYGGQGFLYDASEKKNSRKEREMLVFKEEEDEEEAQDEETLGDEMLQPSSNELQNSDQQQVTLQANHATDSSSRSHASLIPAAAQEAIALLASKPTTTAASTQTRRQLLETARSNLLQALGSWVSTFSLPPPQNPSKPLGELWAGCLSLQPALKDQKERVMQKLESLVSSQTAVQKVLNPNSKTVFDGRLIQHTDGNIPLVAESLNQTLSAANALLARLVSAANPPPNVNLNKDSLAFMSANTPGGSSLLASTSANAPGQLRTAGAFTMVDVEINDYPPAVRAKIMHRDEIKCLSDQLSVSITAKGQYYAPGQKVPIGAKKLFLEIISQDAGSASRAYGFVKHHVEEMAKEMLLQARLGGTVNQFLGGVGSGGMTAALSALLPASIGKYSEM